MIINDYQVWEGKAHRYMDNSPFGAMIGVPLKWQDNVIGVLCVDDTVGRIFTESEAKLLRTFADHAAIAINNAQLVTELIPPSYPTVASAVPWKLITGTERALGQVGAARRSAATGAMAA